MNRILLLATALIIYGSLYPWHFDFAHPQAPLQSGWPAVWDRFEIRNLIVNVMIYIPLGLLAFVSLHVRWSPLASVSCSLLLGIALSTAVELIQVFVPGRYSSAFDILCNGAGMATGIALAYPFQETLRRALLDIERRSLLHPSRSLLLVYAWLGYQLFPLFPSLSLTSISMKIEALRAAPHLSIVDGIAAFGEWIAAAALLEPFLGQRSRRIAPVLLLLMLPAKLVISQRTFTWPELLGASFGCAVWSLWLYRMPGRPAIAAGVLTAVVVLSGLAPFQLGGAHGSFSWVPFSGVLGADWRAGLMVIIRKAFWYGALIVLLREAGARLGIAAAATAAMLMLLEIAQLYIPGHVSEITDPLLALLLSVGLAS